MIRKHTLLAAAMLLLTATGFATKHEPVPDALIREVAQRYGKNTTVNWSAGNNYYKASIVVDGTYLEAFYDLDGNMISMARNISPNQLPLLLLKDVKPQKEKFYVAELFELVSRGNGTEYYITYKNGTQTRIYRGSNDRWSLYRAYENE